MLKVTLSVIYVTKFQNDGTTNWTAYFRVLRFINTT